MDIEVRVIRDDEFEAFERLDRRAFQFVHDEPEVDQAWARGELDRAFAALVDGEIVGIGRNYSFDLTVPGGARVPSGAVSWIGVSPTHRRRGVLTAIMAALAADSRDRGEAVSMLTASEGSIYRRFGYGVATDRVGVTIESARSAFVSTVAAMSLPGRVRFVESDEAAATFPAVYEQTRGRVGSVSRPEFWWPTVLFGYPSKDPRFMVVHETAGKVDGYAAYLVGGTWAGGIPDRTIEVLDLQATDPATHLALWRFLLDVDLVSRVSASNVAIDDPVRWALADPRRFRIGYRNDGLHIRPLDVAALCSARTYVGSGVLRFAVDDAYGHRSEFELDAATSTCVPLAAGPSRAAADLVLADHVLGAVALGARTVSEFAASGGVTGTAAAVTLADGIFATPTTPAMLTAF